MALPLDVLHQDRGVPTSAADDLWNRSPRSSHDLESVVGRYVVGTLNCVAVDQMIRDPRNGEVDVLAATQNNRIPWVALPAHRRVGTFQQKGGAARSIHLVEGAQLQSDRHLLSFVCLLDPRPT